MMMPANYSAVAENEVIYGGAGVADYLPEVWTSKNVRTFTTNIITLVSNSFGQMLINATLGTMFGGNWGKDGVKLTGDDGTFAALYKVGHVAGNDDQTFLNKVMTTLGIASTVYTLGTSNAKEYFNKNPRSTAFNLG